MSFLFLSKLLPLFIYPLGLNCLLLLVALIIWWQKPAWTPIPIVLALGVLILSSNTWSSSLIVRSLERQYVPQGEIPPAEAIVVLGGATKSAIFPRPMVDLAEGGDRLVYAAKLYQQKKAPLIIVTGGRIQWLGRGIPEATDMTYILQMMGVSAGAIIQEPKALNTHENAVYVREILAELHLKRVLLVTSALHMPRALKVFRHQGIDAIAAPTDFLIGDDFTLRDSGFKANLLNAMPDVDRLKNFTKALKEYIGTVVYSLKGWL